jgi:DNA-binding PadR family transcriptional regulator
MGRSSKPATAFLPLTPAIAHILLALADGERHGYAIMQEVERLTGGSARMGPGTLYGTINRLLAAGLVEETPGPARGAAEDERRRYYALTRLGAEVLEAETARLATLLEAARSKRVKLAMPSRRATRPAH